MNFFDTLYEKMDFYFITDERWRYFADGVKITLQVTAGALLIGLVIGVLVAIIRSAHDQNFRKTRRRAALSWRRWMLSAGCI